MENKYYTPSIEEFYEEFEYEYFTKDWIEENGIKKYEPTWCKFSYNKGEDYGNNLDDVEYQIETNQIRIKYLDKEDVESLGFKYNQLLDIFETTIQGRTDTSVFEYWLTLVDFQENKGWRLTINGEDNENSFNGIIKNKSELIKLLKQLGI